MQPARLGELVVLIQQSRETSVRQGLYSEAFRLYVALLRLSLYLEGLVVGVRSRPFSGLELDLLLANRELSTAYANVCNYLAVLEREPDSPVPSSAGSYDPEFSEEEG